MHDAYFVFSFLRALDQVDALKSAAPMLGTPVTLDYARARTRRVEDAPRALEGHVSTTVLNGDNFGPVTLFRVYPDGVDTFSMPRQERTDPAMRATLRAHNAYNRRIFERIQEDALQGHGVVISMTDCYRESDYGEPIVALKSYILSPFSEDVHVRAVLDSIWQAGVRRRGARRG